MLKLHNCQFNKVLLRKKIPSNLTDRRIQTSYAQPSCTLPTLMINPTVGENISHVIFNSEPVKKEGPKLTFLTP